MGIEDKKTTGGIDGANITGNKGQMGARDRFQTLLSSYSLFPVDVDTKPATLDEINQSLAQVDDSIMKSGLVEIYNARFKDQAHGEALKTNEDKSL